MEVKVQHLKLYRSYETSFYLDSVYQDISGTWHTMLQITSMTGALQGQYCCNKTKTNKLYKGNKQCCVHFTVNLMLWFQNGWILKLVTLFLNAVGIHTSNITNVPFLLSGK